MYRRDSKIHSPAALLAVSVLLSLVTMLPSEQVNPRNEPTQPLVLHLKRAYGSDSLHTIASNELKDYYNYRHLKGRDSYAG